MPSKPFHLGWFLQGSSAHAWGHPWTGDIGRDWMSPTLFVDIARALERAAFDYVLIEDSHAIGDAHGGSMDLYLRKALSVPRQEPAIVAALLAAATTRLGIVPTLGTYAYPPYLLARTMGTLDQVSGGRMGWNVVTGSSDREAQNYGRDAIDAHDRRYELADEYLAVVTALWDSWEPGAIVDDRAGGTFADPAKVHTIDATGPTYASRGPLISGPLPQGRPVIAQAGASPRGRAFAARHADTIVGSAVGVEAMKAYRDDVRRTMAAAGRDPDDVKILFLVEPYVAWTAEEADARALERRARLRRLAPHRLALMSKLTGIDFSVYDLDAPLGELELTTQGHVQTLADFLRAAGGSTLRDALSTDGGVATSVELTGTIDAVAGRMDEVMQEVGGDGFLLVSDELSRRHIAEITDGLVPELQRRGLVRTEYAHAHLRDNLREF